MSPKRPPTTLRKLRLSHIGADVIRYEYEHDARCGRCDLTDVLDRGDQRPRRVVDQEWPPVEATLLECVMQGRGA